ncbi:MAG TPA: NAD-dependent epimerase/dehydratase family protein [Candidatus Paceibacterota bacterium]
MNSENNISFFVTGASSSLGASIVSSIHKEFPGSRLTLLKHSRPILEIDRVKVVSDLTVARGDIVIHSAATTHASPEVYRESNVVLTSSLVQASLKAGASHFVYISTLALGAEYGSYGASKAEAEEIVKNSGIPFTIIRLSEMYGGTSNEGLSKLIALVRRFPIVPYIPHTMFAPLYIDDAAQTIVRAATQPPKNKTYVVAGPDILSFRDTVETIASAFGKRILVIPLPLILLLPFATASDQLSRLKRRKNYDSSLAREELSFRPRSFEKGLHSVCMYSASASCHGRI